MGFKPLFYVSCVANVSFCRIVQGSKKIYIVHILLSSVLNWNDSGYEPYYAKATKGILRVYAHCVFVFLDVFLKTGASHTKPWRSLLR